MTMLLMAVVACLAVMVGGAVMAARANAGKSRAGGGDGGGSSGDGGGSDGGCDGGDGGGCD